jgi:cell shape-determining protein MreC
METIIIIVAIVLIIIAFYLGRKFASKPIENKNEEIRREQESLNEKTQQILKKQSEYESQLLNLVTESKDKIQELQQIEQKVQQAKEKNQ